MTHPITNNPELSVVIPCLNEAKTLPSVLARAQEALDRYGYSHEIVVADNGSSDSSPELARNLGARVIHVSQRGYGSALLAGIEAAVGRIIVIGDSPQDMIPLPRAVHYLYAHKGVSFRECESTYRIRDLRDVLREL